MKLKLALVATSFLMSSLAIAQPSVYFLYKHKTTGQTMCNTQAPDNTNWVEVSGPFEDASCTVKVAK